MDIRTCDSEPIHVPGSIQPHGLLLAVRAPDYRIVHAAGRIEALVGYAGNPVGYTLDAVLGTTTISLLGSADLKGAREPIYVGSYQASPDALRLDILVHERDGLQIVELEPALADRPTASRLFALMRAAANHIRAADTLEAAAAEAAAEVRAVTGFDRVMIYQFLADGSGRVIGEARHQDAGSFFNHRFPAGDIPRQARELYRRNIIRVIPDATYQPLPLTSNEATTLDMSDCSLRSVSPIHLQYLANMGVTGSMSVTLLHDGELWGLIACHHRSPLLVPYETREACKHVATEFERQIDTRRQREDLKRQIDMTLELERLGVDLSAEGDLAASLEARLETLRRLLKADFLAFRHQDRVTTAGQDPLGVPPSFLFEALAVQARGDFLAIDDLVLIDPDNQWRSDREGALLFVPIEDLDHASLIWLRHPFDEVVEWAGNPDKPMEIDVARQQLTPRKSFEIWRETKRSLPLPWSPPDRDAARRLSAVLDRISRQQRVALLQAELIHVSRLSAMGAMASALAHELNQPLTAIVNYSSGVRRLLSSCREGAQNDALEYLDELGSTALHAGEIVKRLRSMVAKTVSARRTADLNKLVRDAIAIALPDAALRRIEVRVKIPENARYVSVDDVQIEQVLTNLARNAADAMEILRDCRLTISAEPTCGGLVEVSVADTGAGVPPAVRNKLFVPFNTTKADGMGLGLSICRTIIENHGGRIWADCPAGGGTVFRFTLPAPRQGSLI